MSADVDLKSFVTWLVSKSTSRYTNRTNKNPFASVTPDEMLESILVSLGALGTLGRTADATSLPMSLSVND